MSDFLKNIFWILLVILVSGLVFKIVSSLIFGVSDVFSFMNVVGVTVTLLGLILFLGDILGYVTIPASLKAGIVGSLFLVVIAAAGGYVKRIWSNVEPPEIEVTLLEAGSVTKSGDTICPERATRHSTSRYLDSEFPLLAVRVRRVGTSYDRPNVDIRFTASTGVNKPYDVGILNIRKQKDWESQSMWLNCSFDKSKLLSDIVIEEQDILAIQFLELNEYAHKFAIESGSVELTVEVFDNVTHQFARSKLTYMIARTLTPQPK